MITSYHVHTSWSDGQGEMEDYIKSAMELGLDEIGFSDHLVLKPDRKHVEWSMKPDKLRDYVEAVQTAAEGSPVRVRTGIEADFFPETVDELKNLLGQYDFDYIIGSVHMVDDFPIDWQAEYWEKLSRKERNDVIRSYWKRIRQMAESGFCDFVAHMDLTKKFNFRATIDITREISHTLDAIGRAGMAFEVNTAGLYMGCKEFYPSVDIIEGCFARKIPVLINADAHSPSHLTRNFHDAREVLLASGYRESISYERRQRIISLI